MKTKLLTSAVCFLFGLYALAGDCEQSTPCTTGIVFQDDWNDCQDDEIPDEEFPDDDSYVSVEVFTADGVYDEDGLMVLDFGIWRIGTWSPVKTITIENSGTAWLSHIKIIQMSESIRDDFRLSGIPSSLGPGERATFSVSFQPRAVGHRTAFLDIAGDLLEESVSLEVKLTGMALGGLPDIAIEQPKGSNLIDGRSKINFGAVERGRIGPARAFTITNRGNGNLGSLTASVKGAHPRDFVVVQPGLKTLAPGKTTTFKVNFKPSATGKRGAILEIRSNDPDENPFTILIAGWGSK